MAWYMCWLLHYTYRFDFDGNVLVWYVICTDSCITAQHIVHHSWGEPANSRPVVHQGQGHNLANMEEHLILQCQNIVCRHSSFLGPSEQYVAPSNFFQDESEEFSSWTSIIYSRLSEEYHLQAFWCIPQSALHGLQSVLEEMLTAYSNSPHILLVLTENTGFNKGVYSLQLSFCWTLILRVWAWRVNTHLSWTPSHLPE